jgi:hypothetical protein
MGDLVLLENRGITIFHSALFICVFLDPGIAILFYLSNLRIPGPSSGEWGRRGEGLTLKFKSDT